MQDHSSCWILGKTGFAIRSSRWQGRFLEWRQQPRKFCSCFTVSCRNWFSLKRLWNDIPGESSRNTPCNFLEELALCDSDSFPNIHQLLLIGCTLPVTSAEAECTFSLLRRIKTFQINTCRKQFFWSSSNFDALQREDTSGGSFRNIYSAAS